MVLIGMAVVLIGVMLFSAIGTIRANGRERRIRQKLPVSSPGVTRGALARAAYCSADRVLDYLCELNRQEQIEASKPFDAWRSDPSVRFWFRPNRVVTGGTT